MKKIDTTSVVIGLVCLSFLFCGMKLNGHIAWSWWLVTLPVWGSIAAFVIALLFVVGGILIHRAKVKRRMRTTRMNLYK